jgi:hypothetical protein
MMDWNLERLKKATIAPRVAIYEVLPGSIAEEKIKMVKPGMFEFQAISVGDKDGQAFIVPLDESGRETAELILKALQAYNP